MSRIVYIINLRASRVEKNMQELKMLLEGDKENSKETIRYVKDPTQLLDVLEELIKLDPEKVVIAGGDGTIISCLDYLVNHNYEGVIGILPLGTANNLARNLSLPLNLHDAYDRIKDSKSRKIYLGDANGRVFSLFANIGITARVSKNVKVKLKKRIGEFAYIVEAVKQFKAHDSFDYEVVVDNDKTYKGRSHQIMVINAKINQHLPIVIAPESDVTKPKLTLHIYETQSSKYKIIISILLYIISFGRINRGAITEEVSKVYIKTEPQVPYSLDGEVHQAEEIYITSAAKSVKVLY